MSDENHETAQAPRITFGVPVRNEEEHIQRCLDSILAQDWTDFEIVISDNASTDRTPEILKSYAARDPRIRLTLNEENIGQIANCNQVVRLAWGRYFRWVGGDDWLEPNYASSCITAFNADPEIIAVTAGFAKHDDRGNTVYRAYSGELLESASPSQRFRRMLWSFDVGDELYDPAYGMFRREVLAGTSLIRMMEAGDAMLVAELSLLGRFTHLPQCLAHRWKPYRELSDRANLLRSYHPTRYRTLKSSPWRFLRVLTGIVLRSPIPISERCRCMWPVFVFAARRLWTRILIRAHSVARRCLGRKNGTLRPLGVVLRRIRVAIGSRLGPESAPSGQAEAGLGVVASMPKDGE